MKPRHAHLSQRSTRWTDTAVRYTSLPVCFDASDARRGVFLYRRRRPPSRPGELGPRIRDADDNTGCERSGPPAHATGVAFLAKWRFAPHRRSRTHRRSGPRERRRTHRSISGFAVFLRITGRAPHPPSMKPCATGTRDAWIGRRTFTAASRPALLRRRTTARSRSQHPYVVVKHPQQDLP